MGVADDTPVSEDSKKPHQVPQQLSENKTAGTEEELKLNITDGNEPGGGTINTDLLQT